MLDMLLEMFVLLHLGQISCRGMIDCRVLELNKFLVKARLTSARLLMKHTQYKKYISKKSGHLRAIRRAFKNSAV